MQLKPKKISRYLLSDFSETLSIMKSEESRYGDTNYFHPHFKISLEANFSIVKNSEIIKEISEKLSENISPILKEIEEVDKKYGELDEQENIIPVKDENGYAKIRSFFGVRMPFPKLADEESEQKHKEEIDAILEKHSKTLEDTDAYMQEKVSINLYEFDANTFESNAYKYIEPIMEVMAGGYIEDNTRD